MKQSREEGQWQRLEACYKNGQPFLTAIIEATVEAIVIDVAGMRQRILPWHHSMWVAREEIETNQENPEQLLARRLKQMVGQIVQLRVKAVDRHNHHVTLVQYTMTQEEQLQQQARSDMLHDELQPGDVRQGIVCAIDAHVVCIDLGGLEGFVLKHDLSRERVKHAADFVSIGQEIDVVIVSIDKESQNIILAWLGTS